ncbi:MAG TPA: TonB family protein [Candidatus Angelobacter sp.]
MQTTSKTAPAEPARAPIDGLRLVIEPEPWLRIFLHNLGDLFRPDPPRVWMTAGPGEYWADAQVHRPVAWMRMLQSYLGHAVVVACVYAGNLFWLNQPHVISEDPPQTSTILPYQVSPYLPEVRPETGRTDVPVRQHAQKADPAYSPQRIVSLNVDHASKRQAIIQPDLRLLQQDVPMPNLVAWTPLPVAPVATRHRALDLPAPEVAAPAQPLIDRDVSRLTFPAPPQPQVIAPSSPVAVKRSASQIMSMAGPMVIPPVEDAARRDPSRLQLSAQAPPVAGPSSVAIARTNFAVLTPVGEPEVVPAPQAAARRSLAAIAAPGAGEAPAVVPPAQPIAGSTGRTQTQEAGRLLALNARPLPPNEPVSVPEGSRKGEFAAGPEGRTGASGNPETRKGPPSSSDRSKSGSGPAGVFVDPPPVKAGSNGVMAGPRMAPPAASNAGAGGSASADVPATDKIDSQIFGSRRRYSMHLSMPNLNSAMGSWTVRFAELNANPAERGDLTAPEAIRKVDPAYPLNLMHEQIEGVVVLHAVIRSDGSVGDVRILEGFYEQLDENARTALEQWRFRPGTKNGVPVDVEAVVRVPFRVTKFGF